MIKAAWIEAGRYVLSGRAFAAGVGSAAVVEIGWGKFLAPGWFTLTLLLLSTLELATCYYGKTDSEKKAFHWEKHIVGKLMIISIGIVALILDSIIVVILRTLPGQYQFPLLGSGFLPVTVGALIWLNTAEGIRVLNNVARSQGADTIPPILSWFLRKIRQTDEARYHSVLGQHAPTVGPPRHRWQENLTEEEIAAYLEHMKAVSKNDPPPPGI